MTSKSAMRRILGGLALVVALALFLGGTPAAAQSCPQGSSLGANTGITVDNAGPQQGDDAFTSDGLPPIHGTNWHAQTFTVLGQGCFLLNQLTFSARRFVQTNPQGTFGPADLVVEIYSTVAGFPEWPAALGGTATPLATAMVPASSVPTANYADITVVFNTPPPLPGGLQFAVVFHQLNNGGTGQRAYRLGADDGDFYAGGGYFKFDPNAASHWAFPQGAQGGQDVRMFICVSPCVSGCVRTQGFWKTHGGRGPQPDAWPVNTLTLGGFSYTQSELLDILEQQVEGNGLISLAHQLIAAKLNIASGASAPSAVLTAISQADALMATTFRVPPIGNGFLDPSVTGALTTILDDYNNGVFPGSPPHCE